jgi:hypothetical protein
LSEQIKNAEVTVELPKHQIRIESDEERSLHTAEANLKEAINDKDLNLGWDSEGGLMLDFGRNN